MGTYVLFGNLSGIGGGQLYLRNKIDYLTKKGWLLDVYTGRSGEVIVPELQKYRDNFLPELYVSPFYVSKKKRNEIISRIADAILNLQKDEIIIETVKRTYSLWGELIARQIGAKHIIFNLDEIFPTYHKWYYEFLDFKHQRKELAGIHSTSLQQMFGEYKKILDSENYHLKFCCKNTIDDTNNEIMDGISKADVNLGCISRLDKGYIIPMFFNIVKLADLHPDLTFSFVLVGSAQDNIIIDKINKIAAQSSNLHLYHMGYVSPIPQALIDYVDIFIGTAGSAAMTSDAGKITVSVDTATCQPLGILHYDTEELTFSDGDTVNIQLDLYLERLLFEGDMKLILEEIKKRQCWYSDYMTEFDKHMEFIRNSSADKKYFEFDNFTFIDRLKNGIAAFVGVKNCKKIKKWLYSTCLLGKRC